MTEPARILVVDDDLAIGGVIKRYLPDYALDYAETVQGALDVLVDDRFDLVLLDRRLPDGLGDDVIVELRNWGFDLPIIMMSGSSETQAFAGADDFIEKPFVREALINKIDHHLAAHALRRRAARQADELAALNAARDLEIDVARTIFDRMHARAELDPANVRQLVLAADRLAGDVVLGARSGPDTYRWLIGDFTGHTLSSALVTIPLAGIFYLAARDQVPMTDTLALIERELAMMLPVNMFCVGALCELDRKAGMLRVWNGGNPDLLVRNVGGDVIQIASSGVPLAVDRFGQPAHVVHELPVAPGDRIFAFSDGLCEQRDHTNQMIGFSQLLDIARTGEAATVFDRMVACIPARGETATYDDDISLIEVIV